MVGRFVVTDLMQVLALRVDTIGWGWAVGVLCGAYPLETFVIPTQSSYDSEPYLAIQDQGFPLGTVKRISVGSRGIAFKHWFSVHLHDSGLNSGDCGESGRTFIEELARRQRPAGLVGAGSHQ